MIGSSLAAIALHVLRQGTIPQRPTISPSHAGLALFVLQVVRMIRSGHFGWEDYFAPIMDAITTGGDYYLVANDFIPYIEMQVGISKSTPGVHMLGMPCTTNSFQHSL
jgi:hypothetical protein